MTDTPITTTPITTTPAAPAPAAPAAAVQHAETSPAQRFRAMQDDMAAQRGDGPGHVHTRDPQTQMPLIDGKPASEFDRGRGAKPAATPPGKTAANGEALVKIGDDLEVPESVAREMATRIAAEQAGQHGKPTAPEGYAAKLPETFVAPQGIEVKINEADPAFKSAREIAHRHGLTQEAFSDLLAAHLSSQVSHAQVLQQAQSAELAKLGSAAAARMTSINTFLAGHLGEDAKPLQDSIWTAAAVKSWEKLITRLTTGHGSNFSQQHRDTGKAEVSDETYNSWSPGQRLNYARSGDPSRAG